LMTGSREPPRGLASSSWAREGPHRAYRRHFLDVFALRFLAVEAMVCSQRYEYGGTADAFVEIEGQIWLLDCKTGSGVYPDAARQLASLARA
jgi:hypothetical protein